MSENNNVETTEADRVMHDDDVGLRLESRRQDIFKTQSARFFNCINDKHKTHWIITGRDNKCYLGVRDEYSNFVLDKLELIANRRDFRIQGIHSKHGPFWLKQR